MRFSVFKRDIPCILQEVLTSMQDGNEWSASHVGCINPGERVPGNHSIGVWGSPPGLVVKRRISSFLLGIELCSLSLYWTYHGSPFRMWNSLIRTHILLSSWRNLKKQH